MSCGVKGTRVEDGGGGWRDAKSVAFGIILAPLSSMKYHVHPLYRGKRRILYGGCDPLDPASFSVSSPPPSHRCR